VRSAEQELAPPKQRGEGQDDQLDAFGGFLPLSDGRSFLTLVVELASRAHEMGQGETPVFYDLSAEELQKGVDEALTGKLVPTLKQVRQLFDELKQYPQILHPRDLSKEEARQPTTHRAPPKIKTKEEREQELQMQREFALQQPRRGQVQLIRFKGALYRKAEQLPLRFIFKDLALGGGTSAKVNIKATSLRLKEHLFAFRTSFREDVLVSSERDAQELLSLSQTAMVLMGKLVAEEREQRKEFQQHETVDLTTRDREEDEHLKKRQLVMTFLRLQKKGILDDEYLQKQGYPPDLKPSTLDLPQLKDLLDVPLQEEQDAEARAVRRRKNLGLPEPKRKIWKDVPEVQVPKPRGRPRLT
jgi:hypothetical protein